MAQAQTIRFGQSLIEVSDMETVATFAAPCGFESVGLTVNTETNQSNIPDCADPDMVTWLLSDEVSKQMVLNGEGVLHGPDWKQLWRPWVLDGGEKDVRFHFNVGAVMGGGYFQAPAILSGFELTAERGNRVRGSVTLTMQGKPTWTDAV